MKFCVAKATTPKSGLTISSGWDCALTASPVGTLTALLLCRCCLLCLLEPAVHSMLIETVNVICNIYIYMYSLIYVYL